MTNTERYLNDVTIRLGDRVPADMRHYLPDSPERYLVEDDLFSACFYATTKPAKRKYSTSAIIGAVVIISALVASAAIVGWVAYKAWEAL